MDIKLVEWDDTETLKTALKLVRDVFWDFEASQYEPEGIWEFDSFIELSSIQNQLAQNRMLMWCAYAKENILIGVIAAQPPSHISLLFVDKRVHRKGVGRRLVAHMADYFSQNSDAKTITVNSSPFAVEIYKKMGFEPLGEERTENGIRFTPMACDLEKAKNAGKG